MTRLVAGSATDIGLVRTKNQDHLLLAEPLFAVADGMGGHAAGEIASETALDALLGAIGAEPPEGGWTASGIADAVRAANRAVWDEAQANPDFRGMGTTLTALALIRDGDAERFAVANVGDSRVYRLRKGRMEQLTVDHNLVSELVAEGQIGPEEAETHPQRHVLTRALGVYPEVEVDVLITEPGVGDRFLLCSDGLSREVPDPQIESVLRRLASPLDAASELVALARLHGGSDNITVVVVDVDDTDTNQSATAEDAVDPGPAGTAPVPSSSPRTATTSTDICSESALQTVDLERRAVPPPKDRSATTGPLRTGTERRERGGLRREDLGPRNRAFTFRVALWLAALLAVLAAAYAGSYWYEHSSYYVGLRGDRVTIFHGRPGGLLWWRPETTEVTTLRTTNIEDVYLADLRSGVVEPSLSESRAYVRNLRRRAQSAGIDSTTATSSPADPASAPRPGAFL
jgi:serine/threonine protein phosphatase PrpC